MSSILKSFLLSLLPLVFFVNFANADTTIDPASRTTKTIGVALVSELGDVVPYYDQGFASLMKNQLEISAHDAINTALRNAISYKLASLGYNVVFHQLPQEDSNLILDAISDNQDLFPSPEKRIHRLQENGIFSSLSERNKVDLLITLQKLPIRGEHINGLGVVTKNGALGFTHLLISQ